MIEPSDRTRRALRIAAVTFAITITLALTYTAATNAAEQRQEYIDECDEQYGEDGWVLVEKDVPIYQRGLWGNGPTKCVDIDSPRAEDCVVTHLVTEYNERCADLRD